MVASGESLLKMITELKHSILVNDFETLNENIQKQTEVYNKQCTNQCHLHLTQIGETAEPVIQRLNKEITEALYELENEYYSSNYRDKLGQTID
jgi:hypothetical protein